MLRAVAYLTIAALSAAGTALVANPALAAQDKTPAATDGTVASAITGYGNVLEATLESGESATASSPGTAERSALATSAQRQLRTAPAAETRAAEVQFGLWRDSFLQSSLLIDRADVTTQVVSSKSTGRSVQVVANVAAVVDWTDAVSGNTDQSSWSDTHALTLSNDGTGWVVTADLVVQPLGDSTPGKVEPGTPSSDEKLLAESSPALDAVVTPMVTSTTEPKVNVALFSQYALKWTTTPNNGDAKSQFNPAYPYFNNNCANFASQVLDYAGWTQIQGNSLQVYSTTVWSQDLTGTAAGASRTWSSAKYLKGFVDRNTGAYGYLSNIWNARTGDLLFTDWDPNNTPDGQIDHVMVVSGNTGSGEPMISQKSPNRSNITLTTSINYAKAQGKTIVWYGKKHL